MHDIKAIRANPESFDAAMARRGLNPASRDLLETDREIREIQTSLQECRAERKRLAAEIGKSRKSGDYYPPALEERGTVLREQITNLELRLAELGEKLRGQLEVIPNILADDVPEGASEADNKVLSETPVKEFPFKPKEHFELGEKLGLMDFPTASRMAGSRFVVLKGALAQLERGLGQFMLDTHTKKFGYTEMSVPLLVNEAAMYGTDKLPKFAEDSFQTTDGRWLIPTGEVPLTASVMGEILDRGQLPMRLTTLSPCFRSEAGSAGRDVRGMLRQHQFLKCELVSVVAPEESEAEYERMTSAAEYVLKELDIPFRRVLLCAGDTGFGAAKTYDIEAWMPGQQKWREVSSCSNTRDFQARRMNARFRDGEKGTRFVHTLNGSGLAVGRVMIALMENHQTADGGIVIPSALRSYMNGLEELKA